MIVMMMISFLFFNYCHLCDFFTAELIALGSISFIYVVENLTSAKFLRLLKIKLLTSRVSLCPSPFQETQMVQASYGKEVEMLRQNLLAQAQKLEAAQQRVTELETLLSKKEHLVVEQKKFLEDVKGQAK